MSAAPTRMNDGSLGAMTTINILQITDDFPPQIGGMAAHAWELSKALVRLGHRVTVLTAVRQHIRNSRFVLEERRTHNGVQVVNLGFPLFLRRYRKWYLNRRLRRHIGAFCQQYTDVVLHVHERTRPSGLRTIAGGAPLVFTNHSSMFLADFEDVRNWARLRLMAESCDWITAPSRELCVKTAALGYPEKRLTYIPNGVDTGRFRRNSQSKDRVLVLDDNVIRVARGACVILCARRFGYKNGLHVYLDALEAMPPDVRSGCVLVFAGNRPGQDGEYGQEISRRIEALSCKVECHLLGPVRNEAMPRVYQIADISVLPSLKEATSITGLESLASGVPIVGTNVGGIPEIVEHGVNGLLSPPEDSAALVQNLTRLITDKELRRAMGSEGRRIVEERFSWQQIAERFVEVYRNALRQQTTTISRSSTTDWLRSTQNC